MPQTPGKRDRDADAFDTIAPADVRLSGAGDEGATPSVDRSGGGGIGTGARIALAVLVLIAAGVFLLLPEPAPQPPTVSEPSADAGTADGGTDPAPPAARGEDAEAEVPPFEELRLREEREAAQGILERLLDLRETLEGRAVQRWGAETVTEARATAEAGDAAFLERDYVAARARYREAVATLEDLVERADTFTEELLARGDAALAEGDAEAARGAFELAAAVTPDSQAARIGLERAEVLDEVRARLRDARDVMADGALTAASKLVDEALELDPRSEPARDLRTELDGRIRAARFTRAMSDGYAALRREDFEAARAAFERAGGLRPDAPEVAEALEVLAADELAARIEALHAEADADEAAERWTEAAAHHEAALELDATLAFARRGLARARERAALDAALEETLAHPEHLNDPEAFAAARTLLDRARAVDEAGPRLRDQRARLDEVLAIAAQPVPVTFVSDGETRVSLLRFERLGTFERRVLELRPGAYVATGARVGYRDVRVEFRVTAEGTDGPVVVRCEERL